MMGSPVHNLESALSDWVLHTSFRLRNHESKIKF